MTDREGDEDLSLTIGVLSDTHIPKVGKDLPEPLLKRFQQVDLIIHAGDLINLEVIDLLSTLAPVHGVCGNMDPVEVKQVLPNRLTLSLEGVNIGVTHGWGPSEGLIQRIRPLFPECQGIIFGHSHQPICQWVDGIFFLNPGSPTDKRFSPENSFAILTIEGMKIQGEIIYVK